jgi:hypothetical protein
MVRSDVPPEALVTYELMTVEGWISRSTPDTIPYEVEIEMGRRSNYYFGDQMLFLDAVVVESGLDSRVEAPVAPQ